MREEDLDKYSLEHLVRIAREYQLIDDFRIEKDRLIIFSEGKEIAVSLEDGETLMRIIVRAWIVGGKTIPLE